MPGCSQAAGDLGLAQKAGPATAVGGVRVEDLFDRDLPVQLAVERDEYRTQAASCMRTHDLEPPAVASGRADRVTGGTVGVGIALARSRTGAHAGETSLDLAVAERGEALAGRSPGGNGGQALFGATAMFLLVEPHHHLDRMALIDVQVAAVDQVFRDLPALVATPDSERGDELVLIDQPVLESKQSKE